MLVCLSILILVEEEVFFGGVVGPDVFYAFVGVAFVFDFLEVFDNFERGSGTHGVVDEFVLGCGPGGVFEFRCEFECPVHDVWLIVGLNDKVRKVTHFIVMNN